MTAAAKPPRQKKTPKQRAEETLDAAQRKRDRLHKDAVRHRADLAAIESELADADRRLAYAKQDPALGGPTLTVTPGTTKQSGDT